MIDVEGLLLLPPDDVVVMLNGYGGPIGRVVEWMDAGDGLPGLEQ